MGLILSTNGTKAMSLAILLDLFFPRQEASFHHQGPIDSQVRKGRHSTSTTIFSFGSGGLDCFLNFQSWHVVYRCDEERCGDVIDCE
jgi:hypothetical protein